VVASLSYLLRCVAPYLLLVASGLGKHLARARACTGSACRKLGINDYRNCDDAYYKAYVMERPKHVHKKTFERLRQEVFEDVYEEKEACRQTLYAFAERMRERKQKLGKMLGWEDKIAVQSSLPD